MSPPHTLLWFVAASIVVASANVAPRAPDACAVIGGKKWVSPREVRACYRSFRVVEEEKANIIDVISKMAAFHTSTNYQIKAPEPFASEVHEDLLGSLQRIRNQKYASDYELHIDFSRTLKRLNDGHIAWVNNCYDSLFVNYLPTPLSLITDAKGVQNVHIAYEAFDVASAEFPDQIDFWQNALPGKLKGNLKSLSGAKILLINGRPPFDAVHANALITGSYQSYATRQNS
ncbi:hypothetical protein NLJ89_g9606 [Agrocybe chaxingu]|uniref:Uncharacterized protein n=1 Tax=Agrocybe chaxingu TaxID=84603 RepID=A0A9W8K099_9AGAR|nr:hypothetical protein NLJ89_g9606 [Agrocybe chaxingu]